MCKFNQSIIEAANTEAFKLALRAQVRPHWVFEHFLFYISPAQIRCTVFSTYSTSTAGEDGLYCPLQIRHLVLDLDYTYFQEVFLPLLYEQISGRKRMIYFVDKRFVEKEIWNIKKCILLNVGCDSNTFWWIQKVSN